MERSQKGLNLFRVHIVSPEGEECYVASFSQFKHSVLEGEEAQGTQEVKKVTYLGAQKLGRQEGS